MEIELEKFREQVVSGLTIKQLQEYYNCSRTKITEFKRLNNLIGISPNSKKLNRAEGKKYCNSCKTLKSFEEFYSNGSYSGNTKYKPNCINCESKLRKNKNFQYLLEYLLDNNRTYSCEICGDSDSYGFLDFHHVDSSEKLFNVGKEFSSTFSKERFYSYIVPEMEKCCLLCPSCHRRQYLTSGGE